MHRFYLPPEQCGASMRLEGREAHHAMHVLRLGVGDTLQILDGAGKIYDCRIASVHKSGVQLECVQQRSVPPLPWAITLFQALPKGKTFDLIVEKATELGAHRVVPIISERVVGSFSDNDRKLERWKLTAIDAIKQCGSAWLPRIEQPMPLREAVTFQKGLDLTLVASLHGGAKHPREWLKVVKQVSGIGIGVWVGPEGDFSQSEMEFLTNADARPITLGSLVLRAETAAIYALSVITSEMQARVDFPGAQAG